MENSEHFVYECDIEIKSEPPDDHINEFNETNTFHEIGTEPSTSYVEHNYESTLPHDSFNHKVEKNELEVPTEQDFDENDEFSFESDEVVSNSNIDYQKLLEGIYILEAQRAQAVKDLDDLYELQEQALSDPIAFLEKLQTHNVNLSAPSEIHELPVTDWSKYELNFNSSRIRKQQTELSAKAIDLIKSVGKRTRTDKDYSLCQERPKGRYKLWTVEEQKRLEELLIQYPSETIEARRWEKIASYFEDRTPGQVAGRVQKYFKVLKKHGISVKGGVPNPDHVNKLCSCVMCPNGSTLLVSHQPPIDEPGRKSKLLQSRMSRNFFLYWTNGEQKKLDDLLIKFPPEENENSRWEKISKHFKNRTPRQVANRVSYLKKLMQDGKFVPGKIPGIQFNEISSEEYTRYNHGSNIMQYWTPEEQKRLEELLIQFPPEKHEFQRWRKIANFFPNRTPAQVGSRAKTYFVMLKRCGMPVPGKLPRTFYRAKKKGRMCRAISDHSFFFHCDLPSSTVGNPVKSETNESVEKDINEELERMEKALEEKQRMEKPLEEKQISSRLGHIGYKCSRCTVEPIMGVRWHCTVCKTQSVDFCSECCECEQLGIEGHSFNHPLEGIQEATQ